MLCFPRFSQVVPINFLLLGLFTGGESVIVGSIAAMYQASSVMLALGQTGIATLGLTILAFSKKSGFDLTGHQGGVVASLLIFTTSLLLSRLFGIALPDAAVGGVGALLFSIFLIMDTQLIAGGKGRARQLSDKEYIRGAMELYLDITRIFLYLLKTFGKQQLGVKDDSD